MSLVVACPICNAENKTLLRSLNGTTLYLCPACGVRFSHPMKHPGEEWYEESDIYQEVEWNVPSLRKLGSRWEFKKALSVMKKENQPVFDIGCGRGDFLALAKQQGFQVAGIDLNKKLLQVAEKAFGITDTTHGTVESFIEKRGENQFGIATAFEVMEHLPEPFEFAGTCKKILKSGGQLILSVPCYHRWPHWVNSKVDLPPHHLTLWSEESLRAVFEKNGFTDVQVYRKRLLLNDLMYHAVRFFSFVQRPGLFFKGLRGLLKVGVGVVWLLLKLHPRAGGFTLMGVGTK